MMEIKNEENLRRILMERI